MIRAWIGLGANLGDRVAMLDRALERIDARPSTHVVARSGNYRTPPWGDRDQPEFLNAVAVVETTESAPGLLDALQAIESELGRVRDERHWGPRLIDLDLLLYGEKHIERADLTVPHPRIHQRAFVLVPLCELDPELEIPGRGRVDELLAALDDNERDGIRPGPAPGFVIAQQARNS
ncbi:2-amino-4-hydroxy-6-hydroxymethyldihydropteridine diphosphokinase [Wenzhouxiangella sp. XN201]|uniref:2-amino-4-hydroxy-6- hydroxymethyldihydropteridine diphosphokinase n=1 Tax=Wenzhouxiangella sp. XN201 TaxID=2710755 RepID=UPI0013CB3BD9|nr:2-amino-4-hydroxy-6-hydroxymethyldihydropteridine diphosphokinase [Wenzhouxiangella sp. XN201]NEZ03206.1 2-amino-4-hydroxy-6-hydroxymethyldihydropteridine diphosphokinase [Wenzhouxiangella sp. XN201]